MISWILRKNKIKRQVAKLIFIFDTLLACVYLVALMIQKTNLYKRIGTDRLKFTNKIVARLVDFFDPKTYYSFYERLFYNVFLQPISNESLRPLRESSNDSIKKVVPMFDQQNILWNSTSIQPNLNPAEFALFKSIVNRPPKKVFLYNTPKHLDNFINNLRDSEYWKQSTEISDLNLFTVSSVSESAGYLRLPLSEIDGDVISQFDSESLFVFGIDEAIPPMGHIKHIFLKIIPAIPLGMRVCVYGLTRNSEEDEWIKWNVSFWSAQTLLEVLLSNVENLEVECDSRLLDSLNDDISNPAGAIEMITGTDLVIFTKVYR